MGKTLWGILLGLLFVLPIQVFAWHQPHRQHGSTQAPTSPVQNPPIVVTPPPVVSTSGHYCWNVGQEANVSVSVETPIMNSLKGKTDCVRIADFGTNSSLSEALALLYKSNGFYVEIGNDAGTLSQTSFAQYDAGVIAEAKWSQANSIDEISVGNEQEYRLSGVSIPSWIAHVKALAAEVKQVYAGKVVYSTSGDFVSQWIAAGPLGALDALGENDYCGFSCNESNIKKAVNAWGASHVEVTETNCDIPNVGVCQTDQGLKGELENDLVKLHAEFPTIPMYVFAVKTGGDESDTRWSMVNYSQSWTLLTGM